MKQLISIDHYQKLAGLFYYPDLAFPEKVKQIQQYLDKYYLPASKELRGFTDFTSKATLKEMEELFTRSFDVQAITTLDIGYLLFGDDYKRAELLVNLNREHNEVGNDCHHELADHLPNVLRLLPKMKKQEIVEELADKVVGHALRKMIGEFDPEKLKEKNKVYKRHHKTLIERSEKYGAIYQKPLLALYEVLQQDFKIDLTPEQTPDFLKSIGTEMEID